MSALVFFVALSILMSVWVIQVPKLPPLYAVDAVLMASLFLFPFPQVAILVGVSSLTRMLYYRQINVSEFLQFFRRLVIFGCSAMFFEKTGLRGGFTSVIGKTVADQIQQVVPELEMFILWALLYSFVNFLLIQCEKVVLRRSLWIAISWSNLMYSILFNFLLIAPLSLLMYILFELQPAPFPYALFLLIPPLFVIYRSIRNYTTSLDAAKATIESLADAVDKRLNFTVTHSNKVSLYARLISLELGLSDEDVELVERAARIHDLGKVGIADKILNKQEELNEEEWRVIRKHPEVGAKVASQLSFYQKEVEIIRNHHEHFDGSGYPLGLNGDKIPLGARIVAAADFFEALLSERPHRPSLTYEKAIEMISEHSGKELDPKIVQVFVKALRKYQSTYMGINLK